MITVSDYFGSLVFDDVIMKATLSDDVYRSLRKTIDEGAKLESDVANAVAVAMKDWAVKNGATHFIHWFQPLTGRKALQFHYSCTRRTCDNGVFGQRAYKR